ncbi:hypothetical protein [Xanthomarina sp.]|uniref:hypothetical protein n=1 Tax=Xanthomarina sp. TaxID=1931211 RepID=UPI002BD328C4|nr:hypothetical protein [Xanthomarina sp.]HLV39852.1 hypothetical protein [Xanthomarina sp.]
MMINELKKIIGKKVKRLFLIVWPPFGESDVSQIDISAGYVFEDSTNELFKISTDKNELTAPIVEYLPIPNKNFKWIEFDRRMKGWMDCEEGMEMDIEYYEVSDVNLFKNIVNQKVLDVELIGITNDSPLGVKLIFDNDFILSTPISDGNTIETNLFNKNENLENFSSLGRIEYISLKNVGKNG